MLVLTDHNNIEAFCRLFRSYSKSITCRSACLVNETTYGRLFYTGPANVKFTQQASFLYKQPGRPLKNTPLTITTAQALVVKGYCYSDKPVISYILLNAWFTQATYFEVQSKLRLISNGVALNMRPDCKKTHAIVHELSFTS